MAMAPLLMWGSSVAGPSLQGKSRELASCLKSCYVTPCKVFQFQTYTWLGVLRVSVVDTPKECKRDWKGAGREKGSHVA